MAEMKAGARRPAKKQQTHGRHPDMWWSSLHPADAQQADTQQAVVPYRLVNTLCARATNQIFENLAREVSATLAKHFIENRVGRCHIQATQDHQGRRSGHCSRRPIAGHQGRRHGRRHGRHSGCRSSCPKSQADRHIQEAKGRDYCPCRHRCHARHTTSRTGRGRHRDPTRAETNSGDCAQHVNIGHWTVLPTPQARWHFSDEAMPAASKP
ncbi:hypothetical protein BC831DRAFT_446550 [Entophlyctis helioformis]|nr:hypothetical protein BC831DRAFT_446550 [Entophlyctis helioformis]